MARSNRLLYTLLVGALSSCSDDDLVTQTSERTKQLSDPDGDGMFFSEGCMSADGTDDCLILPGPTTCSYLEITITTTVVVDSSGNVISEEVSECTKCLAEDFSVISESCDGVVDPPIICEPVMDGGGAPTDPAEPDGDGEVPAGSGGGSGGYPGGECWWCHSEDGSVSYVECRDPTLYCLSDEECPMGMHCEYTYPPPCDPSAPCPAGSDGVPESDALIAYGQCVWDEPVYCTTDEECPDGYYCQVYEPYPYPCDPAMGCAEGGGDGMSGSGGADAPIFVGGYCTPETPTDDCGYYVTEETCKTDPRCQWYTAMSGGGSGDYFAPPCEPGPDGTCTTDGYCGYAETMATPS
jgi:hypothetical protein